MSLEPASNLQIFSPTGSGRSTPSPRVIRGTTEDVLLKKDKGFRRYASNVERALALWDTAQQEWADYISFLGRLLKALQSHPSETPVIPHSDTVATRLAQCLNPSLPSGVHQKALEVYGYIFSIIGRDALSRDLNLYFPGLASVLSFASLSVRPLFLSILETYILRLDGSALRPALKAIILCLLPGLEEETSEDFERMIQALDRLREAVKTHTDEIADTKSESGSSRYWQCFFLATITNPSRRQGALAFLVRRLPKFAKSDRRGSASTEKGSVESLSAEAEAAISPEPGLLIRCFEAGLSDPQLLIQRGFLDLLVSNLPLDSSVLQHRISKDDLERLVTAAAGVVSRRDMSLNRRLWAWFLGPEPPAGADGAESVSSPIQESKTANLDLSSHHAAYFSQYGLEALTKSIMKLISRAGNSSVDRAKPFRICLSLMDRWEVGGLIVPEIFLPALHSLRTYSEVASKEQLDEVMKSASVFFDGVESGLIWGKLIDLVTSSLDTELGDVKEALGRMKLAKFILARFNLKEEEMLLHHMPLMVLSSLILLNGKLQPNAGTPLEAEMLDLAFEITDSLIQVIPGRALRAEQPSTEELNACPKISAKEARQRIGTFYTESHGNLDFSDLPFTPTELGQIILREAGKIFSVSILSEKAGLTPEMPSRILSNLIFKVRELSALGDLDLPSVFEHVLTIEDPKKSISLPFSHLLALTSVLSALQSSRPAEPYIDLGQLPEIMHPLVAAAWQYLSPFMPKYHVEAVRCIWQLHSISSTERTVEAAIASIIVKQTSSYQNGSLVGHSDAGRRFAILWTHSIHEESLQTEKRGKVTRRASGAIPAPPLSPVGGYQSVLARPLLLLLDSLWDEGTELFTFMRSWVQNLLTLNKVFEVLIMNLQSLNCLREANLSPDVARNQPVRPRMDDSQECLYYLKHILHILKRPSHYIWATIAEEPAPGINGGRENIFLQEWIVRTCLQGLSMKSHEQTTPHIQELHRTCVTIVHQIYSSPFAPSLRSMELEVPLMARLKTASPPLQSLLLQSVLAALRLRIFNPDANRNPEQRQPSHATHRSRLSAVIDRAVADEPEPEPVHPPPQLVECLKYGFSSSTSRLVLDDWVRFLADVIPLFTEDIFQNLLPLVDCLCKQIKLSFEQLRVIFGRPASTADISPESTLISLINGLEQILVKAHVQLVLQETKSTVNKSPEQPQGFFGNMVSGVFSTSDTNLPRIPTANNRLTVLLCFQEAVRICFSIWSWGGYNGKDSRQDPTSVASFAYTSLRMRNHARRILEHLFHEETLECLETLIVLWAHSKQHDIQSTAVLGLLNVLNGTKPKNTIPAIFNAVYSRTNPHALDANRISTLTSDLEDTDLVAFLVEYTMSLEDDAMDEIWSDCTLFLRDVLSNPLPHRQILPALLEFVAVIGQKVENTNFGEQRRIRKELADLFTRLLTAVFTTRSMGFLQEPSSTQIAEKMSSTNSEYGQNRAADVVAVLTSIVPNLPIILVENDRVANTVTSISTNVIGPTIRAKTFPENVSKYFLDLLSELARAAQANKAWRKDVFDAFNDPRFFSTPLSLLTSSWLPLLAQWTHSDKDRLPELLSRLSAPTTAGIMFGVGAASARQEADRKAQRTLRQISLLVLASAEDAFTTNLSQITEKVVELLTATPASSPSSSTRPEVMILLRALILKTTSIHLAPLWPIINGELTSALSSLLPDADNKETYTNSGIIQACKLLDQLVVLEPDDFQLMEWLFITDTIDAVYKPSEWCPTSLTDEISEILSTAQTPTVRPGLSEPTLSYLQSQADGAGQATRTLFLDPMIEAVEKSEDADVRDMAKRELVERIVRPFLGQLALAAFENTYGGARPDWEGCWTSCVRDVHGVE
jgi:hypothetical protein